MKHPSVNHSFYARDLFKTFDIKGKVHLSQKIVKKKYGVDRLQYLCVSVFIYCFYITLLDIIENNANFTLPLYRGKRAQIYCKEYVGNELMKLRNYGKFADQDMLEQNFVGYGLVYTCDTINEPMIKAIHIDDGLKKKLRDRVIKGPKPIKLTKLDDYLPFVYKEFEDLPEKTIRQICEHAYRTMFRLQGMGCDILLSNKRLFPFVAYFGMCFMQNEKFYEYRNKKLASKIRIQYNLERKTKPWTGYYYFGLTEEQYNELFAEKKGRLKKKIVFPKICICKVKEEAALFPTIKYIFRTPWPEEKGWKIWLENYETRNIELIGERGADKKVHFIE